MSMHKALTIAGSDSSGGAGIQADLKTFQEKNVYGMTALTVIVAMDPNNSWDHQVFPIDTDTIRAQLATITDGIGVDAMKTGMLPTVDIIELAAKTIKEKQLKNVVIDPVMVCKGANEVLYPEHAQALREQLAPLATVITPNLFEASQLSGMDELKTVDDMIEAAKKFTHSALNMLSLQAGANSSTKKPLMSSMTEKQRKSLKAK